LSGNVKSSEAHYLLPLRHLSYHLNDWTTSREGWLHA
jgi:hypothetical protein